MGAKRSPESIKAENFYKKEVAAGRTPSVSEIAGKFGLNESTIRRASWFKTQRQDKPAASEGAQ